MAEAEDVAIEWKTDPDGRVMEHRTEVMAEAECERCGQVVELEAETDTWTLDESDGRWHHEGYGPAHGVCCNLLIASWWEGTYVYDLEAEGEPEAEDDDA